MSDTTLSEIIDKIDIEEYLDQEGIDYKRTHGSSGEQLNVRTCPCCGGDNWKVYLNIETGLGNCFSGSCEAKFNKWKFIQAHTALDGKPLVEYLKELGKTFGWRPPRVKSAAVNTVASDLIIPTSLELPIDGKNLIYLRNRNITTIIAKYFHLRYCDKGWFKYTVEGVEKFMSFASRIIIPIYDLDGKLVSFQGRDITGTADRKYLFPPGYASTGKYLFNGHNVIGSKRVVIGEGVFDVMALKVALDEDEALRNVTPIGTFGKHLAEEQLLQFAELKNRGVEEVIFMWDSEVQALDAAIVAGTALKSRYGFSVKIAQLPNGCDPNEISSVIVRDAFYRALPLNTQNAVKLKISQRNL